MEPNNRKNSIIKGAIIGGIFGALISQAPIIHFINCCCCLGIVISGLISVYAAKHFLKPDYILEKDDTVKIGIYTGIFIAAAGLIISLIKWYSPNTDYGINNHISGLLEQYRSYADSLSPEIQQAFDQYMKNINQSLGQKPSLFWVFLSSGLLMIVGIIFSIIGASLGMKLFASNDTKDNAGNANTNQNNEN